MKKLLIVLLCILALSTIAIFIFIPSNIKVSDSVFIHTTDKWANQNMVDTNAWKKWFPQQPNYGQFPVYNDMLFNIDSVLYNAYKISMTDGESESSSIIHLLGLKKDSLAIVWDMDLQAGMNPAKRLRTYVYARHAKKSMTGILDSLKAYMDKTETVYGIHIEHSKIPDTILVSTKKSFKEYPSTEESYSMLNHLQQYFTKFGAKQIGNPMLNVSQDDDSYQAQVAIPIDKNVPETNDINMKYMFRGDALKAEVHGGYQTIENALRSMTVYKNDFGLQSPAIPYQYIITNRLEEKDTSKWKTILYYPIR